MAGRVYAVRPEPGERPGKHCKVYAASGGFRGFGDRITGPAWLSVKFVQRVEFDADEDEGPAAVTVIAASADGRAIPDATGSKVATATFRCYCRVVPAGPPEAVGAARRQPHALTVEPKADGLSAFLTGALRDPWPEPPGEDDADTPHIAEG